MTTLIGRAFFQNDDSTDSGSETDDEAGGPDEELIGKLASYYWHKY